MTQEIDLTEDDSADGFATLTISDGTEVTVTGITIEHDIPADEHLDALAHHLLGHGGEPVVFEGEFVFEAETEPDATELGCVAATPPVPVPENEEVEREKTIPERFVRVADDDLPADVPTSIEWCADSADGDGDEA